MKYLRNRNRGISSKFLFNEVASFDDLANTAPEKQKSLDGNSGEKTADFDASLANDMLRKIATSTKLSLSVKKRIYDKFKKECGLDDGVINADDDLALKDTRSLSATETEPPADKNSEQEVESSPDGTINKTEYQEYIDKFEKGIDALVGSMAKDPLYAEEIVAATETIISGIPDIDKEIGDLFIIGNENGEKTAAVKARIAADLKNGVYTGGRPLSLGDLGMMNTNNGARGASVIRLAIESNLSSYADLEKWSVEELNTEPKNKELINAAIDALISFERTGENVDWESGSKFDEHYQSIEVDDHGAIDAIVLSRAQIRELGFEDTDDAVSVLEDNWERIQKNVQSRQKLYEKVNDPPEKMSEQDVLALVSRRIKTLNDEGVKIDWEDYNGNVFQWSADGGVDVDRYAALGMHADVHILTKGELHSMSWGNREMEDFLDNNLSDLKRLAENGGFVPPAISVDTAPELKYENGPSVKTPAVPAEEATAQAELAAAQEKESAREQARTSANESFINTVTTKDYAALGITLTGRETLDEKISTIQEKLIEKGQTVSSSGIADKWAGPRTIAALENIRTEYAQKTEKQEPQPSREKEEQTANANKETTTVVKENSPTNEVSFTDENGEDCSFPLDELGDPEDFYYLETNEHVKDKNLILRDSKNDNIVYIKHSSSEGYNNPPENFNVKFVKKGGTWTAESGKWNTDSTGTILDIKKLEAQRQAAEEERAARDLAIQEEQFSHEASLANKKG